MAMPDYYSTTRHWGPPGVSFTEYSGLDRCQASYGEWGQETGSFRFGREWVSPQSSHNRLETTPTP